MLFLDSFRNKKQAFGKIQLNKKLIKFLLLIQLQLRQYTRN